jgi:hypothetical protein
MPMMNQVKTMSSSTGDSAEELDDEPRRPPDEAMVGELGHPQHGAQDGSPHDRGRCRLQGVQQPVDQKHPDVPKISVGA